MYLFVQSVLDVLRDKRRPIGDLLNTLLDGRGPVTGEGMSDDSIINDVTTFLIAGHEITSGLLSFTFYYMLQKLHILIQARKEVDEVARVDQITVQHLAKLPYINSILESLRMCAHPPTPSLSLRRSRRCWAGSGQSMPYSPSTCCCSPHSLPFLLAFLGLLPSFLHPQKEHLVIWWAGAL
ncbi:hypothetical protein ETB97_001420 [Aspergillus alliaceus]|uniref:Cytochrome P450 n=1 Tax=Petromyces alliaceus TaxID=209559 RepID=A0A8H6E721_PETAA|nr:hypothetical protein ETB97_001420 [Aspergillus burnettii]